MCGLCGSFTQKGTVLSKRDRTQRARTLEGLLIANQVRGTDSTGVAAIRYDTKFDLLKAAEEPLKFVARADLQSLLRTDAPLMIGHTRMTSMGNDITDENAHPFVEGNVIGAHNGIINNYMQLDRTVNVDSQAVFRLLDEHPDAYDFVFPKVSGSAALTWWDARDPEALFLTAHWNPLSVAIVPRIKTVFWSSVSDHLESILRASYGSGVTHMEVKKDTIYRLDAEDIYQWQEWEVDFGSESWGGSKHSSNIRVYNHGGYGWEDRDEMDWGTGYVRDDSGAWVPKDMVKGSPDPKASASSPTVESQAATGSGTSSLPDTMTPEEEERYEEYWDRMFEAGIAYASSQDNSLSDSEDESRSGSERLHEMSESNFRSKRFGVDDPTMECMYCDRPMGESGVWDDGLQMMLCADCQRWWDLYGEYATNGGPAPYPLAIYKGGEA